MRQALELALEALEGWGKGFPDNWGDLDTEAITAIKEALAQPEQEPVACVQDLGEVKRKHLVYEKGMDWKDPLYTTPPQPEQKPMAKLQVTLEDRPIDIELAQYKRMFEAACSELGAINEALGLDPNDGGAEPILFAIEQLRGEPQEPVAWMVYTLDGQSVCVTDNPTDFTPEHRALPLYTTPPQPEQRSVSEHLEPVAWIEHHKAGDNLVWDEPSKGTPLYTKEQL